MKVRQDRLCPNYQKRIKVYDINVINDCKENATAYRIAFIEFIN